MIQSIINKIAQIIYEKRHSHDSDETTARCILAEFLGVSLFPIETFPKEFKNSDKYVLLAGPSGYITTPLRMEVCRYDAIYRPRQPWVTYSNNSFLDSGEAPTHWGPLPKIYGE